MVPDRPSHSVFNVHSPLRKEPVRLLRIEGINLDHIQRSNIKAEDEKDAG